MPFGTRLPTQLSGLLLVFGCAAPRASSSSPSDAEKKPLPVVSSSTLPSSQDVNPETSTEHPNEQLSTTKSTHLESPRSGNQSASELRTARQLYDAPITHLATGKRRVASIARAAEGSRVVVVHELLAGNASPKVRASSPLPAALQSESVVLHLFMGRDDWPRVILTPLTSNLGQYYYRFRPATGWDSPTDEQGALAKLGRGRGFYGILGHADPELLCVPDHECYEKRVSGWRKRSVPGQDVWHVVLVASLVSTELEAWAWARQGTSTNLLRLNGDWHAELPALNGNLRQLLTWNSTYVALTSEELLELSPNPSPSPDAPEPPPSWRLLAPIAQGLDAAIGPSSELLLATSKGLFTWSASAPTLAVVELTLPERKTPLRLGVTRRIATTVSPQPRHLVAGDDGLFLLEDQDVPATSQ